MFSETSVNDSPVSWIFFAPVPIVSIVFLNRFLCIQADSGKSLPVYYVFYKMENKSKKKAAGTLDPDRQMLVFLFLNV